VALSVQAKDQLTARDVALDALNTFPSKLPHDKVKHMVVENREFVNTVVHDLQRKIPIREDITDPQG
jgi:hypothetical protein